MKSRRLPERRGSALRHRAPGTGGKGKQELTRRLHGLGLSWREPEAVVAEGLAIVERFLGWVRQQGCVVTGWRSGERREYRGGWWLVVVEAAHLMTRGSFAPDFGNVVPLADLLHRDQQHEPDFFPRRGLDAAACARDAALEYLAAHPADAAWLRLHAPGLGLQALLDELHV